MTCPGFNKFPDCSREEHAMRRCLECHNGLCPDPESRTGQCIEECDTTTTTTTSKFL